MSAKEIGLEFWNLNEEQRAWFTKEGYTLVQYQSKFGYWRFWKVYRKDEQIIEFLDYDIIRRITAVLQKES